LRIENEEYTTHSPLTTYHLRVYPHLMCWRKNIELWIPLYSLPEEEFVGRKYSVVSYPSGRKVSCEMILKIIQIL
jgi:hypothetical protein